MALVVLTGLPTGRIGPAGAAPALGGAPAPAAQAATPAEPWRADPRLHPAVASVAVDSPAFDAAVAAFRATERDLQAARATYAGAVTELDALAAAEIRLRDELTVATKRRDKAAQEAEALRDAVRDLAVDDYIRGSTGLPVDVGLDLEGTTDRRRQRVLVRTVRAEQLRDERRYAASAAEQGAIVDQTTAELAEVRLRIESTTAVRDRAQRDEQRYAGQLVVDAQRAADARLTAPVSGLDFTLVVLDAYVKAEATLGAEQPDCGLRWQLLAGVGRTESRHGTYGDAAVGADGNLSQPIRGIALTGENNTAVITDTDGGRLDGDGAFDRAVGPMQFIPSTWVRVERDGNGDQLADPQNYYDAALTAGVYLCRQGPGLQADDGMRRALLSYNFDTAYGELVLERTHGYDAFTLPSPYVG
ncbi:MAG: hypothetical protein MUF83_02675 [Acidimicrobiales bacterium]|nr:hypothetical protein [Acidimicrobiales bacterium]